MRLRLALAATATVGAGIAAYLVYVHYAGVAPVCTSGGCATVQSSRYAELLGVPVALLGLLAFVAILASALVDDERAAAAGAAVALAGVAFGVYLLAVQLAVLHAVCEWCVASDATMAVAAALAVVRLAPPRTAVA